MIYLASPYSHAHRSVRHQRFIAVALAAGKLMQEGEVVYAPIVHNHPIAELMDLPREWEYWKKFDGEMLEKADRFMILELNGWTESTGIQAETKIWIEKDKGEIEYMEPVE